MDVDQAKKLLGNRPDWELKNMIRALQILGGFLNTPEDNNRLQAAKVLLKEKRRK